MNNVNLVGRLCRDTETFTSGKGKDALLIGRYTIAIDRGYDKDAATDFIPCVVFGKSAEFAEKYFKKGLRVAVSGRLQTGSYEDKDGVTRYTFDVAVNQQEFADGKKEDTEEKKRGRR